MLVHRQIFRHNGISLSDLPYTASDYFRDDAQNFHSNGRLFTADEQEAILAQACSAWYIGIVFTQVTAIY